MKSRNTHFRNLVSAALAFLLYALLPPTAQAATVRASLHPIHARKAAPDFSLPDSSGNAVRLSSYRGKIVLLNFWATECGGCRLEIPSLIQLDRAYKGRGLVVVGASMDISYEGLKDAQEGWSRVKPFVEAHGIKYPILMVNDDVTKLYGVEALPVTYLIDGAGRIAATYLGILDKTDVEVNIKALLLEH